MDKTPANLLKEMEANKIEIVQIIGQKKFDEEIVVLDLLKK